MMRCMLMYSPLHLHLLMILMISIIFRYVVIDFVIQIKYRLILKRPDNEYILYVDYVKHM